MHLVTHVGLLYTHALTHSYPAVATAGRTTVYAEAEGSTAVPLVSRWVIGIVGIVGLLGPLGFFVCMYNPAIFVHVYQLLPSWMGFVLFTADASVSWWPQADCADSWYSEFIISCVFNWTTKSPEFICLEKTFIHYLPYLHSLQYTVFS